MRVSTFADQVFELIGMSPLYAGKRVYADLIANPKAGGFTMKLLLQRHVDDLAETRKDAIGARAAGMESSRVYGRLRRTEYPGHASEMADAIAREAEWDEPSSERIIVTAGGDGTILEVQSRLAAAPEAVRSRISVLRLPMGTGNDGADAKTLRPALALLAEGRGFESRSAVRVRTAGGAERYAFNIASLGLDAFVTRMTNKLKGKVPGDSYRLWVDLASVFYDLAYPVGEMGLRALGRPGEGPTEFARPLLLAAMGVSGRRSYGSGIPILPDDRNVCTIRKTPLLRKLAIKGRFKKGTHAELPEAQLFGASRVVFDYAGSILCQTDGESFLLGPKDFPLVMELTDPLIRVIRR